MNKRDLQQMVYLRAVITSSSLLALGTEAPRMSVQPLNSLNILGLKGFSSY